LDGVRKLKFQPLRPLRAVATVASRCFSCDPLSCGASRRAIQGSEEIGENNPLSEYAQHQFRMNYHTRVNLDMLNYRSMNDMEECDIILTCGLRGGAPARTRSQARAEEAGAGPNCHAHHRDVAAAPLRRTTTVLKVGPY
jgi:hypothetical protein